MGITITPFNGKFDGVSNESMPPPPQVPREFRQKAYFAHAIFAGQEIPSDATVTGMVQAVGQIYNKTWELTNEANPTRQRLQAYLTDTDPLDPHVVEPEAAALGSYLLGGISRFDTVDLVVAVHGSRVACMNVAKHLEKDRLQAFSGRYNALEHVLQPMLISRAHRLTGADTANLKPIYDRIFGGTLEPEWSAVMHEALQYLEVRVEDYLTTRSLLHEGRMRASQWATEPTPYNAPLSKSERNELIRNSAYVLERLQCLKEYGISPLVVPAETVELPWDISILPPTFEGEYAYEEGAIADFTLLLPSSDPHHGLIRENESSHIRGVKGVTIGDDPNSFVQRLRLHDNGQVSFGRLYHNVPNDTLEVLFDKYGAHDGYERLRGLLIALASDCVVPDTVLRERMGGSVASQYQAIRQNSPWAEVVNELLLARKRELGRARVGPKNRVPDDWDPPFKKPVRGYISALPAGCRRRPTADQDARDYYKSIGRIFDGLKKDENFTRPYKRKSSQAEEELTVRRARFNSSSTTARFLGWLGAEHS